jgi:hypothetical protein
MSTNACLGRFNGAAKTLTMSVSSTWHGMPENLVSELFARATRHCLKAVAQGSSGAPLLLMEDGSAFIVGMQVAMRRQPAPHIMLAIPATALSRRQ